MFTKWLFEEKKLNINIVLKSVAMYNKPTLQINTKNSHKAEFNKQVIVKIM